MEDLLWILHSTYGRSNVFLHRYLLSDLVENAEQKHFLLIWIGGFSCSFILTTLEIIVTLEQFHLRHFIQIATSTSTIRDHFNWICSSTIPLDRYLIFLSRPFPSNYTFITTP